MCARLWVLTTGLHIQVADVLQNVSVAVAVHISMAASDNRPSVEKRPNL